MAKTRLNKTMRGALMNLAEKLVKAPDELHDKHVKAEEALTKALQRVVDDRYPTSEVKVLKKHQAVTETDRIYISKDSHSDGDLVILEGLKAWRPNYYVSRSVGHSNPYVLSTENWNRYITYKKAKEACNKYIHEVLQAYNMLINGSTNLDDVIEVWPEASQIHYPVSRLPLPKEMYDKVRADIKKRSK